MRIKLRMCRWLTCAIASLHVLVVAPVLAQQIPTDERTFTAFVAERVRTAVRDVAVVIKGPLTLSIGPLQANLDRVYAFCKANAAGCAKEIETYVGGVAAATRNQSDPPTKEALRVVVRSTEYMRQALGPAPGAMVTPRPLVEGLVIVPVLDSPRTLRMLNDKDRATLGLTTNQAFDIGIANLRNATRPLMEVAKAAPPGQIGTIGGDYYQTSRLALPDSWAPLAQAQRGVLIVAAPSADVLLYVGEDSGAAIDALRTLAKGVMARSPKPLSGALLRWTPKGWQLIR
ncbi:hypothetical protein [Bradyrhizobium sp. UFLA05-112]